MLKLTDKLSEHFRAYEFACHGGQRLPSDVETQHNIARLAVALEALRGEWAAHLRRDSLGFKPRATIISGWRSPAHNAAVDGAKDSWHMRGLAADVACVGRSTAMRLREGLGTEGEERIMMDFAVFTEKYVERQPEGTEGTFGGLGVYSEVVTGQLYWVHLDLRPRVGGRIARWHGHHTGSEQT